MSAINWTYSKNAAGEVKLTGYEPDNQSGAGDSLCEGWTDAQDALNTTVADDLTGPVSQEELDRILTGVLAAPEGDGHQFRLPMATRS